MSSTHSLHPESTEEIQQRYARRIKARLAQPSIDLEAARDGMLDCFVSTYHAGLSAGVKGILDIDAGEAQIARLARNMFRKKLEAHDATFDAPSIEALDRVKEEVDQELHFEQLPAEIRGVHDQVCSLLLAKADGSLAHRGPQSAVTGGARGAAAPGARTETAEDLSSKHLSSDVTSNVTSNVTSEASAQAPAQAPPAAPPRSSAGAPGSRGTTVDAGLRDALHVYLATVQDEVKQGASVATLRQHLARLDTLVQTLEQFSPAP